MRKDIEQLLFQLFNEQYRKELTDKDVEEVLNQDNVFVFTTKDDEGTVIAMLTLYVVKLFSRRLGVIEEVVTLKGHRNKGIGSSLVRQAIDKAREQGCDCVELCVRNDRPGVKAFYEYLGFSDRNNTSMRLLLNI